MKVDFNEAIHLFDGTPIKIAPDKDMTLAHIAAEALGRAYEGEQVSGEEAIRRFDLGSRVYRGGEQEISPEDATLLRGLIPRSYAPLIAGQALKLLEGK